MQGPAGVATSSPGGEPQPLLHPLASRIAFVALATFVGLLAFESLKEALVSPGLSRWQSHWMTVSFAALVASMASFFVLRVSMREVAARRQAQAVAEAATADLRAFLHLTSEGIARFDLDEPLRVDAPPGEQVDSILRGARLMECNEAFVRMLRRPIGERLAGLRLAELAPPHELVDGLREFISAGYRLDAREQLNRCSDGSSAWTRANLVGLVDDARLVGIWLSQGDITLEKEAREDLRARGRILEAVAFCSARFLEPGGWTQHAEEALASLGEAARVGGAYVFENRESDGSLLSSLRHEWTVPGAPPLAANPLFRDFPWAASGPIRSQLEAGKPLLAAVHDLPAVGQELLASLGIQSVLIVPVIVEGRWWGLLGFGEFRHARLWSTAEVEALRTAAVSLGAAVLRERAEKALRDSEERFRSLIQEAPVAVSISRDGRTLYTNKKHDEMFGYEPGEDVPGRLISDLIAPGDREEVLERARRRALGLEAPRAYEIEGMRRDGSTFPMHVAVEVVHLADGPASLAFLTDFTARRRADEALRASEKKYRDIFDYAPIGIYQARPDGTLITANDAFARLLGFERGEDVLGLNLARDVYFDPEERSRLIARYEAIGHAANVEVELKRRDGTRFWSEMSSHAVKDAEGQSVYFESFVQDITARKTAEAGLRESEARYRLLFEGNPLPMLVYDPGSLALLAANAAAVLQYGYSYEELLRLSVPDLATSGDPLVERLIAQGSATRPDVVHVGLTRQRRRDGASIDADLTSLAITFGGRPARLVLMRDVTAERQAEVEQERLRQALETEAAEWQRTVDAVDTAILILDPAMRTTRMNRAARDLLGHAYAAGPDTMPEELFADEPWHTGIALTERARVTGAEAAGQARNPSSGRSWDVTAYVSAPTGGREERIILVIRDITRLAILQDSLRRSETMAALGSLVAGVAHEVRNPLFSITATLDAFEATLRDRGEYADYVTALRSPVARLNQLTRDLLDYGKPPQLRTTAARPEEIVRRALRACAFLARDRGVELADDVAAELPSLDVDAARIDQVFQNLVANAIQHSKRGGRVCLRANLGDADTIEFRVEDEGPGLEPGDLPHLFEPFFSRRRGGTGLGLSIVERIVEAHGGRIEAGNRPERGAVFTVRVPVGPPATGFLG